MVKAPFALEAAGRLGHAPRGKQQSENLPPGAMKVFNARKAGKAKAGGECSQREKNSAHERFLAQAEDRKEQMHNPSMYAGGARAGGCDRRGSR